MIYTEQLRSLIKLAEKTILAPWSTERIGNIRKSDAMSSPEILPIQLDKDARCDGCGCGDHFNGHRGWVPYAIIWCCSETGQHYESIGWLCQICRAKPWQFKGRVFLGEKLCISSAPSAQPVGEAVSSKAAGVPIEKMLRWFDEHYPHEEDCKRKTVARARKTTKCDCYRAEAEMELKALFPAAVSVREQEKERE